MVEKKQRYDSDLGIITADNSGPMTFDGTKTYILGKDKLIIIDPGPNSDFHLESIKSYIGSAEVSHIIVTHSHEDHYGLASKLSESTGAPIYGFHYAKNRHRNIRKDIFRGHKFSLNDRLKEYFQRVNFLSDGETITGSGMTLEVIYTPGHLYDHICLAWLEKNCLFSGDHVMSWSTTLISPPEGDMGDFLISLEKLITRSEDKYFPGHGSPVPDGRKLVRQQINHRKKREDQILFELNSLSHSPVELVSKIYPRLDSELIAAAANNIFAHLINMYDKNLVIPTKGFSLNEKFKKI